MDVCAPCQRVCVIKILQVDNGLIGFLDVCLFGSGGVSLSDDDSVGAGFILNHKY